MNSLGSGKRTNALADLHDELLAQSIGDLVTLLDRDKGVDSLSRKLVRNTDDSSLANSGMLNESSLDFGSGKTVTTDIDNIINTAANPVKAFVVSGGTVTSEL